MNLGLGIDAGGTYTDTVIIDFASQRILAKSKALTTRDDFSRGIKAALVRLPPSLLPQVRLISLSTTLATNAIVEGTGGKVGALLLGFDAYDLARIDHRPVRAVRGRMDITGREIEALDEEGLLRALIELCVCEQVDAIAISGMVSVRNPAHEIRAKEILQIMTGFPVVCAHELSTQLNSIKRTQTAILNARLLSVIAELLTHVRAVMDAAGLDAPLMVVRGDGTLMHEESARQCPVETILSGPAASICGARFLCDIDDALVVDIGGTTSDIALVDAGQPRLASGGIAIGEWATDVRAVEIETVGLGGDSAITLSSLGKLSIGPRRAIPLAYLAHEYPTILVEMCRLWDQRQKRSALIQPVEFFLRISKKIPGDITPTERATLQALQPSPLSRDQLAKAIRVFDPSLVPVSSLEARGYIQRSTLTPTDILHYEDVFSFWDQSAAGLGLALFAYYAGRTDDALATELYIQFANDLARHLLHRLVASRYPFLSVSAEAAERALFDMIVTDTRINGLAVLPRCDRPLIAIGAPAEALASLASHKLAAKLIVPEHADVANAVGAITGACAITVEATITQDDKIFLVHTPKTRREFPSFEEANAWAGEHIRSLLDERIAASRVEGLTFTQDVRTIQRLGELRDGPLFLDGKVRGIAVGKPMLLPHYNGIGGNAF
ncbi:MAG: hydantoinase/oxoprolinase N-terminal domain-containing protein [Armatimonadota bacterium]